MTRAFSPVHNGRAVARETIPVLPLERFRDEVIAAPVRGQHVAALFGVPAEEERVALVAVLAAEQEGVLLAGTTVLEGDHYPAMTPRCPQVHLFEREIAEEWGVVPDGHPWFKPVRFVRGRRRGRDAWARGDDAAITPGVMDFYRVEGDEVHEVAVGPVHAGVIEPGHFRFQCHGETVMHLEISLGYQHRGVERALRERAAKRAIHYAETLAGDTSVGHATAYCTVLESLAGTRVSARAHALRGIALELERLANHTGGLGGLANDVGFLPTASYCGRLRGEYLNLTAQMCGSRFGRGMVRPGGVGFDIEPERAVAMRDKIASALRDVRNAADLLWSTPSVQARFEDTGHVATGAAETLGLVGVAARACGLERDVRQDFPLGVFQFAQIPVAVWTSGDVFARAYVRWLEIERSTTFLLEKLAALPSGAPRNAVAPSAPNRFCVALVEGWRGEICHVARTDPDGRLDAYKIVDPSFHNWMGLALALRGQPISDFPLCNKSFDLSYCGFDL